MATDLHTSHKKKSPFGQLLDAIAIEYAKIGQWNEDLQRDLPKKWEKHGDMILLPENAFTMAEWRMLGRDLWKVVAQCMQSERVGRKRRIEKDDYRSPHIELLYGQHGWVEHIDNGISYQYDVTKCMFSIGNINEKIRIANFDCKNEVVVDMFAGIGYFTLPYLVHAKAQLVHACEWNPDAIEALVRNLTTNKVMDRCIVYEGDCRKVCPVSVADRVNLGLLPTARAYWLTACKALKPSGGILHIHENVTSSKLKKSMSRQESTISNSDVIVGDSVTIKYCYEDDEEMVQNGNGCHKEGSPGKSREKDVKERTPPKKESKENSEAKPVNGSSKSKSKSKGSKDGSPLESESSSKAPKEKSPPKLKDSIPKESSPPSKSSQSEVTHPQMIRRDSLFDEMDFYEPPVHESFQSDWTSQNMDGSWKQFSLASARRIKRFLDNLHDAEWDVTILRVGKIKSYAPRIDHIVLDVECRPRKVQDLAK